MFRKSLEEIQFHLREDECTFLIISLSVLLRMRNVSEESYRANQNAYFMFNLFFLFFFENRAFNEITCENIAHSDRPQMTVWRMRIAFWISKATNAHSEYVILTAFLLEQWLDQCASMLRCTYIACLYNTIPLHVSASLSPSGTIKP